MTRIATPGMNEMIGIQIGKVQQAARNLDMGQDLQEIEAGVVELEKRIAGLKEALGGVTHYS